MVLDFFDVRVVKPQKPSGKRFHNMERSTMFNGKIHISNGHFQIAMLNYQMVKPNIFNGNRMETMVTMQ